MQRGEPLEDDLWQALESRFITRDQLREDESVRARLLNAHWDGLAWEQGARLQHLRVSWEAQQ